MYKLTIKQEKFCLKYIESGCASTAYRYAYSTKNKTEKTVWECACRLKNSSKVLARVKQLKQEFADKSAVTVESIARELEEARQVGLSSEQSSAMVAASMGKAKLYGLITDKKEFSGSFEPITVITRTIIDAKADK